MNHHKAERFASLLIEQSNGSSQSADQIRALDIQPEDGLCLFNLHQEWQGAFSFAPGRMEALGPIRRLSNIVGRLDNSSALDLYKTADWQALVSLRGPFECAIRYTCQDCATKYVRFGQSGFDDRRHSVCSSCGGVWLQSAYDDTPLPRCSCGGSFSTSGCPSCGSNEIREDHCFSSYEYFANHQWAEKMTRA